MKNELSIGIVGAGGFAHYAAHAFSSVSGIKIVAVADKDEQAAYSLAESLHAKKYIEYEKFLLNNDIELVYIATPPFLHYSQSKLALQAGKHVICEKPAALKTQEAEELVALAQSKNLLYTVNLMQRYNPLFSTVKEIIAENLLGDFLHGYFENYASDENLLPFHWFWDETKSGGIFIEHGVHFFDLFTGWLGKGEVIHATQLQRPNITKKIIDRVQATVAYQNGCVNFYHGFDQPKLLDRQEMKLQFERGDITLYEWIPVKIKIHALVEDKHYKRLLQKFLGSSVIEHTLNKQVAHGRFKEIHFNKLITLEQGDSLEKDNRYRELLVAMIQDQWSWINDQTHVRVIDHQNAVESLRMAEHATNLCLHK